MAGKRRWVAAAAVLVFAACIGVGSTWSYQEFSVDAPEALKAASDYFLQPWSFKRRISDLTAVRDALQHYHAEHGAYPVSTLFDGRTSHFGESRADWIQGLAPQYIARLPADPRRDGLDTHQYLYMSDGADYKLLSHLPEDIDIVADKRPDMIDPNQTCSAYGYWTPGAVAWFPNPIDSKFTAARLRDLVALAKMLDDYRIKYKGYPKSEGFDGLYSSWGKSGQDWIAGLVPEFTPALPRDPRRNDDPANQYLYKSDGYNYKLLVHHPEDCPIVRRDLPRLIDPVRGCLAYGVWTDGAKDW